MESNTKVEASIRNGTMTLALRAVAQWITLDQLSRQLVAAVVSSWDRCCSSSRPVRSRHFFFPGRNTGSSAAFSLGFPRPFHSWQMSRMLFVRSWRQTGVYGPCS